MINDTVMEHLFQTMSAGDRLGSRRIVESVRAEGVAAEELTQELLWPLRELINDLHRADQLSTLAERYATRILRTLTDQMQAEYVQQPRRNRSVLMLCGASDADELAGQMISDLIEADGYDIFHAGGGIANDEVLAEVGRRRPDILLIFVTAPADEADVRDLVDRIRTVDACPDLQIVLGGEVFTRADDLVADVAPDLCAKAPGELLAKLEGMAEEDLRPVKLHTVTSRAA